MSSKSVNRDDVGQGVDGAVSHDEEELEQTEDYEDDNTYSGTEGGEGSKQSQRDSQTNYDTSEYVQSEVNQKKRPSSAGSTSIQNSDKSEKEPHDPKQQQQPNDAVARKRHLRDRRFSPDGFTVRKMNEDQKQRKRFINRLSARRTRERERTQHNELSNQLETYSKLNEKLRLDNERMGQLQQQLMSLSNLFKMQIQSARSEQSTNGCYPPAGIPSDVSGGGGTSSSSSGDIFGEIASAQLSLTTKINILDILRTSFMNVLSSVDKSKLLDTWDPPPPLSQLHEKNPKYQQRSERKQGTGAVTGSQSGESKESEARMEQNPLLLSVMFLRDKVQWIDYTKQSLLKQTEMRQNSQLPQQQLQPPKPILGQPSRPVAPSSSNNPGQNMNLQALQKLLQQHLGHDGNDATPAPREPPQPQHLPVATAPAFSGVGSSFPAQSTSDAQKNSSWLETVASEAGMDPQAVVMTLKLMLQNFMPSKSSSISSNSSDHSYFNFQKQQGHQEPPWRGEQQQPQQPAIASLSGIDMLSRSQHVQQQLPTSKPHQDQNSQSGGREAQSSLNTLNQLNLLLGNAVKNNAVATSQPQMFAGITGEQSKISAFEQRQEMSQQGAREQGQSQRTHTANHVEEGAKERGSESETGQSQLLKLLQNLVGASVPIQSNNPSATTNVPGSSNMGPWSPQQLMDIINTRKAAGENTIPHPSPATNPNKTSTADVPVPRYGSESVSSMFDDKNNNRPQSHLNENQGASSQYPSMSFNSNNSVNGGSTDQFTNPNDQLKSYIESFLKKQQQPANETLHRGPQQVQPKSSQNFPPISSTVHPANESSNNYSPLPSSNFTLARDIATRAPLDNRMKDNDPTRALLSQLAQFQSMSAQGQSNQQISSLPSSQIPQEVYSTSGNMFNTVAATNDNSNKKMLQDQQRPQQPEAANPQPRQAEPLNHLFLQMLTQLQQNNRQQNSGQLLQNVRATAEEENQKYFTNTRNNA